VQPSWTLQELVAEVSTRIAALPAPRNGQVRAIPDERTVRYYGTIGLLDRPSAMRGRTALYGRKHVAQVVAIKRLQALGRSLSEIQTLWPTLDDRTLARMSGVELDGRPKPAARAGFWKHELGPRGVIDASAAAGEGGAMRSTQAGASGASVDPEVVADAGAGGASGGPRPGLAIATPDAVGMPIVGVVAPALAASAQPSAVELRVELAPNVILSLSIVDETIAISPADVCALRAAAAPLVAELASRRITPHLVGEQP
jgi:hypothetical protein